MTHYLRRITMVLATVFLNIEIVLSFSAYSTHPVHVTTNLASVWIRVWGKVRVRVIVRVGVSL